MSEPSELECVLAALDSPKDYVLTVAASQTAARLLREMAADFDEYADHGLNPHGRTCEDGTCGGYPCTCGLDAARERWRLPS